MSRTSSRAKAWSCLLSRRRCRRPRSPHHGMSVPGWRRMRRDSPGTICPGIPICVFLGLESLQEHLFDTSPPARDSALTRSGAARFGRSWERSTGRATRSSTGTSRSRSSPPRSPTTPTRWRASSARRQAVAALSTPEHPRDPRLRKAGRRRVRGHTELLEGETLRARVSGGPISLKHAADYALQILKGSRRPTSAGSCTGTSNRERVRHEGRTRQDPRLRPRGSASTRAAAGKETSAADGLGPYRAGNR
jgi:hypothetical protein